MTRKYMGEALGKIPKGDTSWVFVGTSKPDAVKKKEISREDSLFNTYLQEIFDVADPIVKKEQADFAQTQGKIAVVAAGELNKKNKAWKDFKEHKDIKRFILEQDVEWRGRDVPKRLERMLVFGLIGGGAFGADYTTDWLSAKAFKGVQDPGNRAALKEGWENLTDYLIGKGFDYGAKLGTNKKNVGFVTPFSSTLGQIGNTALTMLDNKNWMWNSLINPGVIESGLRAINAVPWVGALTEKVYAFANKELLEQDGTFPFIFSMAYNMMMKKEMHKGEERIEGPQKIHPLDVLY